MEWFIMNSSGVRSLSSGLGEDYGDSTYRIHDECAETLEEMINKMENDDPREAVTKRHLLAEQVASKDIVQLIKFAHPDVNELQLILKLLSLLCEPVTAHMKEKALEDLKKLSSQICRLFVDSAFVEAVFKHIHELIDEAGELQMAEESYLAIKHLLELTRNVLFQSDDPQLSADIIHELLKNRISSVILFSINCHSRYTLAVPVVQVLSLLYKNFQWENEADTTSESLCCLIVQLLQGSLETLAICLKKLDMTKETELCDYLAWAIAYFLPFTAYVKVSVVCLRRILRSKFVGYLVYQASMLSLDMFAKGRKWTADINQRAYLLFSALESIITLAVSSPVKNPQSDEGKIITSFLDDVVRMYDLWEIILFYIRSIDIIGFAFSFLSQLVVLNHKLLTAVSSWLQITHCHTDAILEHIKQFASAEVMSQYTLLVERYERNTAYTNMAVFTMLSHICIDCDKKSVLYTPRLLRALSRVCHSSKATSDDKALSKYVLDSFLDGLTNNPEVCVAGFLSSDMSDMDTKNVNMPSASDWSDDEECELLSVFANWKSSQDVIKGISIHLTSRGYKRSPEEVKQKLQASGLIPAEDKIESSIPVLVRQMARDGHEDILLWLHNVLLTASYIKAMPKDSKAKTSPLCHYAQIKKHDCPIIPYNEKQESVLRHNREAKDLLTSFQLLGKTYTHSSEESFIPFIPDSFSAGQLYTMAEMICDVDDVPFDDMSDDSSANSSEVDDCFETLQKSLSEPAMSNRSVNHASSDSNLWLFYMANRPVK